MRLVLGEIETARKHEFAPRAANCKPLVDQISRAAEAPPVVFDALETTLAHFPLGACNSP